MNDLIETAARSAVRGSLLFHLDLAQILAIDALPPEAPKAWAVEVDDRGYVVTVLSDDLSRETFAVTFAADGAPIVEPRDHRALPRTLALASTRQTALEQFDRLDGLSVIALPPAATAPLDGPLEAYVLGRDDYRLTISADGRHLLAMTAIADDAAPSEAHVYRSLKRDQAITLVTPGNGARWRIAAGEISLLD